MSVLLFSPETADRRYNDKDMVVGESPLESIGASNAPHSITPHGSHEIALEVSAVLEGSAEGEAQDASNATLAMVMARTKALLRVLTPTYYET